MKAEENIDRMAVKLWEDRENIVKYSIISYKVNSEYLTKDELRKQCKIYWFKWIVNPHRLRLKISII